MKEKAFFLRRLNDHTQYLNKVNAALSGRIEFQGTYPCGCKLGGWLCGDGEQDIESYGNDSLDVFYELYREHQKFHDASNEALTSHQNNDTPKKTEAFTQMHVLSAKLVNLLLKLDTMTTRSTPKAA